MRDRLAATLAAIGALLEKMPTPRLTLRLRLEDHGPTILLALGAACLGVALGWLVAVLGG